MSINKCEVLKRMYRYNMRHVWGTATKKGRQERATGETASVFATERGEWTRMACAAVGLWLQNLPHSGRLCAHQQLHAPTATRRSTVVITIALSVDPNTPKSIWWNINQTLYCLLKLELKCVELVWVLMQYDDEDPFWMHSRAKLRFQNCRLNRLSVQASDIWHRVRGSHHQYPCVISYTFMIRYAICAQQTMAAVS